MRGDTDLEFGPRGYFGPRSLEQRLLPKVEGAVVLNEPGALLKARRQG